MAFANEAVSFVKSNFKSLAPLTISESNSLLNFLVLVDCLRDNFDSAKSKFAELDCYKSEHVIFRPGISKSSYFFLFLCDLWFKRNIFVRNCRGWRKIWEFPKWMIKNIQQFQSTIGHFIAEKWSSMWINLMNVGHVILE